MNMLKTAEFKQKHYWIKILFGSLHTAVTRIVFVTHWTAAWIHLSKQHIYLAAPSFYLALLFVKTEEDVTHTLVLKILQRTA